MGVRLKYKSHVFNPALNGQVELVRYNYVSDLTVVSLKIPYSSGTKYFPIFFSIDNKYWYFDDWICLNSNNGTQDATKLDCEDILLFGLHAVDSDWIEILPTYYPYHATLSGPYLVSPDNDLRIFMYNGQTAVGADIQFWMDIYLVFFEDEEASGIPYKILTFGLNNKKGFGESDVECQNTYQTHLASVYSDLQRAMVGMLMSGANIGGGWLGAKQFITRGSENEDGGWKWIDGTGTFQTSSSPFNTFWSSGRPSADAINQDCLSQWQTNNVWNDALCTGSFAVAICNSNTWFSFETKTFQINIAEQFDEMVLVSISNANVAKSVCIDHAKVTRVTGDHNNLATAKSIGPSTWIGGQDHASSSYAFFLYPVCSVDIVDTRPISRKPANKQFGGGDLVSGSCQNKDQESTSSCTVSTSIDVDESKSIELTTSTEIGRENSLESSSSRTVGTELSVGFSFGAEFSVGVASISSKLSLSASASFEYSSSQSNTQTTSTVDSSGRSDTISDTITKSINCEGSIDVPPLHSVDYFLTIEQKQITIDMESTLKITLCSAFTSSGNIEEAEAAQSVYYIYNVPGSVQEISSSVCSVIFSNEDIPCNERRSIRILGGSTYIPLCDETDAEKYDGCQCEEGDRMTEAPCWCVDPDTGRILLDGPLPDYIAPDASVEETCAILKCPNSKFTTPTPSPTSPPSETTQPMQFSQNSNNTGSNSTVIILVVVICLLILGLVIILVALYYYKTKKKIENAGLKKKENADVEMKPLNNQVNDENIL